MYPVASNKQVNGSFYEIMEMEVSSQAMRNFSSR
jgi:hypothetical protein